MSDASKQPKPVPSQVEVNFKLDAQKKKQIEECLKKGAATMKLKDTGVALNASGGTVTAYEWD